MHRLLWILASLALGAGAGAGTMPPTGLVVVEQEAGRVILVDAAGDPAGTLLDGLVDPRGVSTDLDGNLLVAETGEGMGDGRVHRVAPDAQSVVLDGLDFPEDVDQAPDGSYLVVASGNSQVLRVSADGGGPTPVIELEGPAIGLAVTGTGREAIVAAVPWQGRAGVARREGGEFELVTDRLDGGGHPAFLDGDRGLELCVPEFAAERVGCWPLDGDGAPRVFPIPAPVAVAESEGVLYVTSRSGVTAVDPASGDSSEVVGGLANPAGVMIAPEVFGGAVPVGGDQGPAPAPAPPAADERPQTDDDDDGISGWALVGLLVALAGLIAALVAFLRRKFGVRSKVPLGDGMEIEIVSDEEEDRIRARLAARDMAAAEARHAVGPPVAGEAPDPCAEVCAEAAAAEARARVAAEQAIAAHTAALEARSRLMTATTTGAGVLEASEAQTAADDADAEMRQLMDEAAELAAAARQAQARCDDCRKR